MMEVVVQSTQMSVARGVVGGLVLACLALAACSDGISSPSGSPPPGPTDVQVSYCHNQTPEWVAVQDGDGPWTRVAPTASGGNTTFRSTFSSNRGGIARLSRSGTLTILSVLYGTPAELVTAGITTPFACGSAVSKTLLGTAAGLDTNEFAIVSAGVLSHSLVVAATGGHFALRALPSGPLDLAVLRATRTNGQAAVTRFILRRDVDLPDTSVLPVLDFSSSEAFAPATATLTLAGLDAEGAGAGVHLITGTTEATLSPVPPITHEVSRPYAALPEARLRAGDLQLLFASATSGSGDRTVRLYFRTPSDRTLTLPAPLIRPTFTTLGTTPLLRLRAHFVAQPDYDRAATITYQRGTTTLMDVTMTAGYAALTGGYDLDVPDLSAAAGFDPAWALHPGSDLRWMAGRVGGTLGLGVDAVPSVGATRVAGFDSDVIPGL
jgi:hypothetical protein